MSLVCRLFGVTRQSYYQRGESYYVRESYKELVYHYLLSVRQDMPSVGCFKLYEMAKAHFGILPFGRDAFFGLLREKGLMLKIKKRRRVKTTDSNHAYRKYPDLVKGSGRALTSACQLWVSDITYIPLKGEGRRFCYLSLVTDAYSRKIVGWQLGEGLQYKHTEQALRNAIDQSLSQGFSLQGLIHHSDRGVQYAYPEYTRLLTSHGCRISMTQTGDPRDNPIAERVNGILKTEWLNLVLY